MVPDGRHIDIHANPDPEETYLETERLMLRRFRMDDADLLVELDSDPDVMRFLSRTPTSREEIETHMLPDIMSEYERDPGFGRWAAIERRSGAFVGRFGLRLAACGDQRAASLGYRLRRSEWGYGFATEGGRALIDHAFSELGIGRIRAQTMAVNLGSRRVMEKCGMRYLRTFHEHFDDPLPGTELGEVEYEIRYEELARPPRVTAP